MDFGARGPLQHHFHNEIQLRASMLPQMTVHRNEEWTFPSCKIFQRSRGWDSHLWQSPGISPGHLHWRVCYPLLDWEKPSGLWVMCCMPGFCEIKNGRWFSWQGVRRSIPFLGELPLQKTLRLKTLEIILAKIYCIGIEDLDVWLPHFRTR